jgi:hypothetical protein
LRRPITWQDLEKQLTNAVLQQIRINVQTVILSHLLSGKFQVRPGFTKQMNMHFNVMLNASKVLIVYQKY